MLLAAAAALLLAGCSTFESRSKEKAAVFNSLDTSTQERLKKGEIALGDTAEMVYLALGNPDERTIREAAETVVRLTGSRSPLVEVAPAANDPRRRCPDITRARSLLGWEPVVGFEAGLRSMLDD